jgi:hypothetical protein
MKMMSMIIRIDDHDGDDMMIIGFNDEMMKEFLLANLGFISSLASS